MTRKRISEKTLLSLLFTLLFSLGVFWSFSFVIASEAKPARIDARSVSGRQSRDSNFVDGEVIAKIKPKAEIDAIAKKHNLSAELIKTLADGNLYVLKCPDKKSCAPVKKIIKTVKKNSNILSVQPNFKYKPLARLANDRHFASQWSLEDKTSSLGGVAAASFWDTESKSQTKVPIAVIDTGVSYKHQDLAGSITGGRAKGKSFTNPKRKPQDYDGHGSFISGIIAAKTNNKKGVAGASFWGNLKIMPLKFDFTTSQAIEAINFAKTRNIPVINASWGGYGDDGLDPFLRDAIAAYPGVFVTASGNGECESVGNSGLGCDHDSGTAGDRMYPCDFDLPNIVCVGASDRNGALAGYSDFGATSVDLVAPGGTDADPLVGLDYKKNKYTFAEGSSLSTAFVSAEAGLIISKYPHFSAERVIEIIKNSVDTESSLSGKVATGGKINFLKAMQLAATY